MGQTNVEGRHGGREEERKAESDAETCTYTVKL